jgi:hypothetical protein
VFVSPSPGIVHATGAPAGRLAADALGALGVERAAVVLAEPGGTAVIAACCGRPELVGARTEASGGFGWGPGPESRFLIDDDDAWSVVSVPIPGADGPAGTVAVATRRRRGLTTRDVELLDRLTARAVRDMAAPAEIRPRPFGRRRSVPT